MKFLADENFPIPSIELLKDKNVDIKSVAVLQKGISDLKVIEIAIDEHRTILTHDSDYGELIFKYGYRPRAGVVYFRIFDFEPTEPGDLLLSLIQKELIFENRLTVINENTIRQRFY